MPQRGPCHLARPSFNAPLCAVGSYSLKSQERLETSLQGSHLKSKISCRGGQRPWATTARAGASPLFGSAQATYPVEIVIGGDAAQELQPSGVIAAPAMKAAAHLADFVQGGVLGDGAVHLQLIAGLPIFLPLDDLLVVTVGDGGQPIERDGGEVIATAQGRATVQEAGVEQHPAGTLPCSAHGSVLSESRSAPCRWSLGASRPAWCRPCSARATSSLWLSGCRLSCSGQTTRLTK